MLYCKDFIWEYENKEIFMSSIFFYVVISIKLLWALSSHDLIFPGPKFSPVRLLQNPFQFHSLSDQQMKIIEISLDNETGPRQLQMCI